MKLKLPSVFIASSLLLAGCSTPADTDVKETSQVEDVTVQEEAPIEEAVQADGTEASPWPVGTPVRVGDWELTVNSWQPNVNDAVAAAGDDMSMLQDGYQYALLNVTMTWLGEGVGSNSAVNLQYMPEGGNTIASSWAAFGTTPGENKLAYEDLVTGGSVTGDMLYEVDAGNTDGVFMVIGNTIDDVQYLAAE